MPNAGNQNEAFKHVLLCGASGTGKSTLAYYAPTPLAALLLDKSSLDTPPGVDASQIYFKTYPPALVDLSNDKHGRARNIADAIIRDIQLFRDHFTSQKKLQVSSALDTKTTEEWPTPKTLVLEGADFLSQHILNLICVRHGKLNPSEFGNKYEAWGLRLNELHHIYDILTYLPCNVIVTTGLHTNEEQGNVILPNLGGAMNEEGPRKFHSSLMLYADGGKHYVRTRSNAKYKGFKLGGKFGAPEIIEITLDNKSNPWVKLFGETIINP